jgi:hypothetical protein
MENNASESFFCRGNVFTELLPSNDRGIHSATGISVQQFSYCCLCTLPRERVYRVLASDERRDTITELFPATIRDAHADPQTDGRKIGSRAMIYEGGSVNTSQMEVKRFVMDVIGFPYVSIGSSTVQFHDSLGNRRACPCSEAGFSSQNVDHC